MLAIALPKPNVACVPPTKIPQKNLTDQDIEVMWAADRYALVACYGTQQNYANYIRRLRSEFGNAARK